MKQDVYERITNRIVADLEQLEAWKAALFDLKHDRRPEPERTAAGRYRDPTLLTLLQDAAE